MAIALQRLTNQSNIEDSARHTKASLQTMPYVRLLHAVARSGRWPKLSASIESRLKKPANFERKVRMHLQLLGNFGENGEASAEEVARCGVYLAAANRLFLDECRDIDPVSRVRRLAQMAITSVLPTLPRFSQQQALDHWFVFMQKLLVVELVRVHELKDVAATVHTLLNHYGLPYVEHMSWSMFQTIYCYQSKLGELHGKWRLSRHWTRYQVVSPLSIKCRDEPDVQQAIWSTICVANRPTELKACEHLIIGGAPPTISDNDPDVSLWHKVHAVIVFAGSVNSVKSLNANECKSMVEKVVSIICEFGSKFYASKEALMVVLFAYKASQKSGYGVSRMRSFLNRVLKRCTSIGQLARLIADDQMVLKGMFYEGVASEAVHELALLGAISKKGIQVDNKAGKYGIRCLLMRYRSQCVFNLWTPKYDLEEAILQLNERQVDKPWFHQLISYLIGLSLNTRWCVWRPTEVWAMITAIPQEYGQFTSQSFGPWVDKLTQYAAKGAPIPQDELFPVVKMLQWYGEFGFLQLDQVQVTKLEKLVQALLEIVAIELSTPECVEILLALVRGWRGDGEGTRTCIDY